MANDTKDRILVATAASLRMRGYTGTGLKQVVADASAPFGSIYHFFPGGKEELAEAVILREGAAYFEIFAAIFEASPDPVSATAAFFAAAAEVLRDTDYADACPIATIALEVASTNDRLRRATAEVFEDWITGAADRFRGAGMPADRARPVAISLIALLEGAFVLARALRSTEPLESAGATAVEAVRAAMA